MNEPIKEVDERQLFIIRQSSLKMAWKVIWPLGLFNVKKLFDVAETITEYVTCGNDSEES